MMLFGPLLIACIPGICILLITWWLSKKSVSLFVKLLPGLTTIVIAIVLFYIGFENIRGFEGAAYGLFSIFLILFASASFVFVRRPKAT
ncbi:YesK family protein [Niallia taxi]|uniref:YesK family protein n=1 Tax=Niallia taxi TaxID=2499688 RepID=UPI003D2874EB